MIRLPTRLLLPAALLLTSPADALAAGGHEAPVYELRRIAGVPGPEDLALDRSVSPPRILVSSQDRREPAAPGAVFALIPGTVAVRPLSREGEPAGFVLHPHGIDLVRSRDGRWLLYVISHPDQERGGEETVAVYELLDDRLALIELLKSRLLTSPNDLSALPDGTLYVSNFGSGGGLGELLLSLRRSTVAMYRKGEWSVAADRLALANGIVVQEDRAYIAVTRANAVLRYSRREDGILERPVRLARVKGPDNLFLRGHALYAACHEKPLAFMRHTGNSVRLSPSLVWQIDARDGTRTVAFADDGGQISAASGVVLIGETLYVGQVFGDFVMACTPRP